MEPEKSEFLRLTSAPREVVEKLERYAELLIEWNEKFNLVAPSTIPHIWSRHFLDSAQLVPMVAEKGKNPIILDLGSGAGFPGLVLSIFKVSPVIHLTDSIGKKADFLEHLIEALKLDAVVQRGRIQDIKNFKADIVTARAVARLDQLFLLAAPFLKPDSLCLFMKGKNADLELTEVEKYWMFDCKRTQSLSDSSGTVLGIRNLKRHAGHNPKLSKRK